VPFARPVTLIEVHGAVHVPVKLPGDEVAVYDVIAEPPSLAGAVNDTVACALPPVAVPIVGAPGIVAGVTLFEAADAGPVPTPFVAVTVNAYAVPLASPVTVMVVQGAAHVAVNEPGDDVAVYEVIAEPPLLAGAVKATLAWALPAVAMPIVGAPGAPSGTTPFEEAEGVPVPAALVAVTVNVYEVPFVSPSTVIALHGAMHVPVMPPGEEVAVYEVIAAPPSLAGAVKSTVACALPGDAMPIVGAPGTVAGVAPFDAADAGPVPIAFVAVTLNVYVVPFTRPVTSIDVQGAVQVPVIVPGEDVAVYDVIAEPPSLAGAVKVTVACALPAVAVPIVGAPGTSNGVTLLEAAEEALAPAEFTATTVKV
jgi:hypothetical protein